MSQDFYYNSVCHVCKLRSVNLKRCASCRCIAYCSKDHQISDWIHHKQICKIFSESKNFVRVQINSGYDHWRSYRTYLQFYLVQKLKRDLLPYESQMWMFPRNCNYCYSTKNCEDCQECFCVVYCSPEHKNLDKDRHKKFCKELKLGLDLDIYSKNNLERNFQRKEIYNIANLPENIMKFINDFVELPLGFNEPETILLSEIFSNILTTIYGLERCGMLINRNIISCNLTLHVIGADMSELWMPWKHNIKLLEDWIENLNLCKIFLIGPELNSDLNTRFNTDKVSIQCFNDYYHNVTTKIEKPDLIVAFNSGLHEFDQSHNDTWNESLSKIIKSDVPLLLTAYTEEELRKDLKRLEIFNTKSILDIQKNPFSHQRPIRDWDSKDYKPFYVNGYISIITGNENFN